MAPLESVACGELCGSDRAGGLRSSAELLDFLRGWARGASLFVPEARWGRVGKMPSCLGLAPAAGTVVGEACRGVERVCERKGPAPA